MAVKIVRQPNKIALIGVPSSAGAHAGGTERAPAALRAAGLADRLRAAGYQVTDLGDCPVQVYQPDEEHPRARNVEAVLAALHALRAQVELATKAGDLPLVLGGDCTLALGTVAGLRRYYRAVSIVYLDRDADLNVPATTPSGCLDGMVVAHLTGRGAPELVRFWSEPPLVRDPEVALFGLDRLDEPEQQLLERVPIRRYTATEVQRLGPAEAARAALERIHAVANQVVLHFDADVISSEEFGAVDVPGVGGLRLAEVRQALDVFVGEKNLAAIELTEYNPERDTGGAGAALLVEALSTALAARLEALTRGEEKPAEQKGEAPETEAGREKEMQADPGPALEGL